MSHSSGPRDPNSMMKASHAVANVDELIRAERSSRPVSKAVVSGASLRTMRERSHNA